MVILLKQYSEAWNDVFTCLVDQKEERSLVPIGSLHLGIVEVAFKLDIGKNDLSNWGVQADISSHQWVESLFCHFELMRSKVAFWKVLIYLLISLCSRIGFRTKKICWKPALHFCSDQIETINLQTMLETSFRITELTPQ